MGQANTNTKLIGIRTFNELMGVAPVKIISVVILSFEVVLVSSPNIIIVAKEVNKQV